MIPSSLMPPLARHNNIFTVNPIRRLPLLAPYQKTIMDLRHVEEEKKCSDDVLSHRARNNDVILLRGGGCQAAVVWETLQSTMLPSFLSYASTTDSTRVVVWADGEGPVHSSLQHLPRVKSAEECVVYFDKNKKIISSEPVAAGETHCEDYGAATPTQVFCYVAVGKGSVRKTLVESVHEIFDKIDNDKDPRDYHLSFPSLVHPKALVSPTAQIGQGCFVGPFALIHTHAKVGNFCLVNSSVLVEHDCSMQDYVTVNPGAVVLGTVQVRADSTIGSNATVREKLSIASETTVGMGAAVVRDIVVPIKDKNNPSQHCAFWGGVPARPVMVQTTKKSSASDDSNDHRERIRWCFRKPFSSQRILDYLTPSLEKGHITNDGPLQPVVTAKVKAFVGSSREVLMACNGTGALHALVAGISLRSGKPLRWVTQAFTFPSSIQGPLSNALVADLDPTMKGPSLDFLEMNLDKFDGVIVTNIFGHQADIVGYEQWCKEKNKFLVFDNAASPIGVISQDDGGRCIHDAGDGAIVSLHETKPIGRGEGGAVLVDRELSYFVHQAMNFGYDILNQVRIPNRDSSNWRMSDIAAAAICDHLDFMTSTGWKEKYEAKIRFAVSYLEHKEMKLAFECCYPTILSCLFIKLEEGIGGFAAKKLNGHNIEAKHYYTPLVPRGQAPEAWKLYDTTVCLPFHLQLSDDQIRAMIDRTSSI